jgi:hypothetical protein
VFVPSFLFYHYDLLLTSCVIYHQTALFRDRVRARDQCCVVTGAEVPDEDFTGFEAAHIFPVAHIDLVWLLSCFLHARSFSVF